MNFLEYNSSFMWNIVSFGSIMFGKGQSKCLGILGIQLMPFHTTFMTIILMVLGRFSPYVLPILPQYQSTFGGEIFPFSKDLRDYQYDIENFFYDCNNDISSSMSTSFG